MDLDANVNHCGQCGVACGPGEVCSAGTCMASCQPPLLACNNVCTNVSYDPANCGGCAGSGGVACVDPNHGMSLCNQGDCLVVCDSGYANCSGDCRTLTTRSNSTTMGWFEFRLP